MCVFSSASRSVWGMREIDCMLDAAGPVDKPPICNGFVDNQAKAHNYIGQYTVFYTVDYLFCLRVYYLYAGSLLNSPLISKSGSNCMSNPEQERE